MALTLAVASQSDQLFQLLLGAGADINLPGVVSEIRMPAADMCSGIC
jgi:hypothetical protein